MKKIYGSASGSSKNGIEEEMRPAMKMAAWRKQVTMKISGVTGGLWRKWRNGGGDNQR
jgi:hypothetical protein